MGLNIKKKCEPHLQGIVDSLFVYLIENIEESGNEGYQKNISVCNKNCQRKAIVLKRGGEFEQAVRDRFLSRYFEAMWSYQDIGIFLSLSTAGVNQSWSDIQATAKQYKAVISDSSLRDAIDDKVKVLRQQLSSKILSEFKSELVGLRASRGSIIADTVKG